MSHYSNENPELTAFNISARGFLRALALVVGIAGVYVGAGGLYLHRAIWPSLLTFMGLIGLMCLFAVAHAQTHGEPSEMRARTSERGVIRWLGYAAVAGCTVTAQYSAWYLHLKSPAFVCMAAAGGCMIAFAFCYSIYATMVKSDCIASSRSICRGSGRQALMLMALVTCFGFIAIILPGDDAWQMMGGLGAAIMTVCLYAFTNAVFSNIVKRDADRG
jgi:hypothetical protein